MNILLLTYEDCRVEKKDVPPSYKAVAPKISADYNNIIHAIYSHNKEINDKDVVISVKRLSDEISFKDYDTILFSVELLYDYSNPIFNDYLISYHNNNIQLEQDREYMGFTNNGFSSSSGGKVDYNKVYNSMVKHREKFYELMSGELDVDIIMTYNPYLNYSDRLKFNPLENFKITEDVKLDFCDLTFFDDTVLKKAYIQRDILKTGIHTEQKKNLKLKMKKNPIGLIYCSERLLIIPTLLPDYVNLSKEKESDM